MGWAVQTEVNPVTFALDHGGNPLQPALVHKHADWTYTERAVVLLHGWDDWTGRCQFGSTQKPK